jgi:hypothetical protein
MPNSVLSPPILSGFPIHVNRLAMAALIYILATELLPEHAGCSCSLYL